MPSRPDDHRIADNNGYPSLPGPRRLPPLLRRAWFALNQTFRQRLGPVDLTPDQFTVLRWIIESSPKELHQRQLANLMTSDPNTITSILSRMEISGLIERRPHPRDRRAQLVHITETGRQKFNQAKSIALDLQAEILAAIPIDQHADFLKNLELVANCCHRILDETKNQNN
jgi:DNA-binding MarR family transcriptional regulator